VIAPGLHQPVLDVVDERVPPVLGEVAVGIVEEGGILVLALGRVGPVDRDGARVPTRSCLNSCSCKALQTPSIRSRVYA
jgi:hypothetical protein